MDDIEKQKIRDNAKKHCQSLSKEERKSFEDFLIENDELMKELAEL